MVLSLPPPIGGGGRENCEAVVKKLPLFPPGRHDNSLS